MMSRKAWEALDWEAQQAMLWLEARLMARDIIEQRTKKTRLRELELATLKPSTLSRKGIADTSTTAAQGTAPKCHAGTTSTNASTAGLRLQLVEETMPRLTKLDWVYRKLKEDPDFKHLRDYANFVPGDGPYPDPAAILIGEAPGAHEDKLGRPFVGQSGNMLEGMMWDAGLKRADCFITNVVKWRPPGNRTPTNAEVEYAIPYLRSELMAVMPNGGLVILLGSVALSVADQERRVMSCHGEPFSRGSWTFMPMAHPSYVLQGRMSRDVYRADWRKIKELTAA